MNHGSIMLAPDDARPSTGRLDEQGRFALGCYDLSDGVVRGRHRVAVTAVEPLGEKACRWWAPPKYSDHRTSGLQVEIDAPTDSLRIDLTWSGGAPFVEKSPR